MRRLGSGLAALAFLIALAVPAGAQASLAPAYLGPGLETQGLAAGPEGTLWAAGVIARLEEPVRTFVTRLAPTGKRITFSRPSLPGSRVGDLIRGPAGSMWLTVPKIDEVVKVDRDRDWQVFQMPERSRPTGLASVGGDIWVTLKGRPELVRIDPADQSETGYALAAGTSLTQVVGDSRERLWAISANSPEVVGFSPADGADYIHLVPLNGGFGRGPASDIAVASDGDIWISEAETGAVGRIEARGGIGAIAGFGLRGAPATMISPGPGGDIWFADGRGRIGSIGLEGELGRRSCAVSSCGRLQAITRGPEGRIWFATGRKIAPVEGSAAG